MTLRGDYMAKRIASHMYTVYKSRGLSVVKNDEGCLYSNGRYTTKLKKDDLPEWFVFGYMYGQYGFLDTKSIVDLFYSSNYTFENHYLKYDKLYISYNKPIIVKSNNGWNDCEDFDEVISGPMILDFVEGAKKYSNFDVSEIEKQLDAKEKFFREKNCK